MQYNHYPSATHQVHPAPHSNDEYPSSYPDPSHNHSPLSYAAVSPGSHFPAGSIPHQNLPPQYPYATQPEDQRSYYATSQVDYPPSSPTTSYATPSPLSPHLPRHPSHLSQPQQQFIPTPSQAFQVYSSTGPAPARSRSSVEPYYHMSPNPQHVVHPSSTTHATSGTSGRSSSSTAHRSSSHHVHTNTIHTGTIVVAAGERYPCDLCDRSFTRLHDRRRHYDTVHATSPVSHMCRFCQKGFSRSDSLKRHVDNGCDDMPR